MNFFDTFQEMLAVLFTIGLGYLAKRLGYMDENMDHKLSGLVLNITTPVLVLNTVLSGDALPEAREILSILLGAVVFYSVAALFVALAPGLVGGTPKQLGVWRYTLSFANIGFIGYPVVQALFGDTGLFYAVILALPFNVLSYSLGPLMVSGKLRFHWKQFCSPAIICSVIALVIALVGFRPPEIVGHTLSIAAQVHVPLSLLILGSLLAGSLTGLRSLGSPRLWIISALRLLVMPAALAVVMRLLHMETMLVNVAVVQMAMPTAISGSMMCMEFGGDADTMARITFLTTVLSIVTIPIAAAVFL